MAKQTKQATVIERIRAVYPLYADLLAKQRELLDRQDELKREVGGNTSTWRTRMEGVTPIGGGNIKSMGLEESLGAEFVRQKTWEDDTPKPEPRPALVRREVVAANALLDGLVAPTPPEEPRPAAPPKRWPGHDRYRAISEESDAIVEALRMLAPEIAKARKEYSRLVVQLRGTDHAEIVEHVTDAARALGDVLMEYYAFIDEMRVSGVEWKLFKPLDMSQFGDLAEDFSPLRKLILDAVQQGHVGSGKIPGWHLPTNIQTLMPN